MNKLIRVAIPDGPFEMQDVQKDYRALLAWLPMQRPESICIAPGRAACIVLLRIDTDEWTTILRLMYTNLSFKEWHGAKTNGKVALYDYR